MTSAAYIFMGIVWVTILGTATVALKRIISSKA